MCILYNYTGNADGEWRVKSTQAKSPVCCTVGLGIGTVYYYYCSTPAQYYAIKMIISTAV